MMKLIKTHSRLVCEVPLFRGEMEINLPQYYSSPYSTMSMFVENKPDYVNMFAMSWMLSDQAQIIIQKIHDVLRL